MMARYIWLERLFRVGVIFESLFSSEEKRELKRASQVERAAEKLRITRIWVQERLSISWLFLKTGKLNPSR